MITAMVEFKVVDPGFSRLTGSGLSDFPDNPDPELTLEKNPDPERTLKKIRIRHDNLIITAGV